MRGLGYLFGILMLVDAIPSIFQPQFWVRYTERNLKGYLPGSVMRTMTDFSRLSDDAVRGVAVLELIVGMMLLSLASMVPTVYFAGRAKGHATHTHEHVHGEEEEEIEEPL
ncbi:MAG: hypothetical protein M0Z94_02110 [Dehalococcoidales bacterium]|nr:hypothetical protein [Dehalococcoidales bacterium]